MSAEARFRRCKDMPSYCREEKMTCHAPSVSSSGSATALLYESNAAKCPASLKIDASDAGAIYCMGDINAARNMLQTQRRAYLAKCRWPPRASSIDIRHDL